MAQTATGHHMDVSQTKAQLKSLLKDDSRPRRFPKDLEDSFQDDYLLRHHRHMQIASTLGCIALLCTGVADFIWLPEFSEELMLTRGAFISIIVLFLFLSQNNRLSKFTPFFAAANSCLFSSMLITLALLSPSPLNYYYYCAVSITILVTGVLTRLQFGWSVSCAVSIWILLNIGMALDVDHQSVQLFIINNFTFVTCAMFAVTGTYLTERNLRDIFLQGQLLALENTDLEKTNTVLHQLSTRDELTQLANRRAFDTHLKTEWRQSLFEHKTIGLILMDVDHFKLFNDTYGHQRGDDCLRQVANVITNSARRSRDLAARYGGEEFVVIFPGVDIDQLEVIAERLREEVMFLNIAHEKAPFNRVTISIGIASVIPDANNPHPDLLIAMADSALYRSKRTGRNKVERHHAA